MSRPGWARECTCGETPASYFCRACMAWSGGHLTVEPDHHTRPRDTVEGHRLESVRRPTPKPAAYEVPGVNAPKERPFRGGRIER